MSVIICKNCKAVFTESLTTRCNICGGELGAPEENRQDKNASSTNILSTQSSSIHHFGSPAPAQERPASFPPESEKSGVSSSGRLRRKLVIDSLSGSRGGESALPAEKTSSGGLRASGRRLVIDSLPRVATAYPKNNDNIVQNRYEIIRPVKRGGMGAVYEAYDIRLKKTWALKEMTESFSDEQEEQEAKERFQREATLLASLDHPNLPRVIDYFEENGHFYLVMDFIIGKDLNEIVKKTPGKKLSEEQVTKIAGDILDILQYLHSQDPPIIYRDIKPGNIMIRTSDQSTFLIDFGIARIFSSDDTPKTEIGTVGYAPPEQYMGNPMPSSDIYALGATMHELLTGTTPRIPFKFDPLTSLEPSLSQNLNTVVMRALEHKYQNRWKDALDMKEALLNPPPPPQEIRREPAAPEPEMPAAAPEIRESGAETDRMEPEPLAESYANSDDGADGFSDFDLPELSLDILGLEPEPTAARQEGAVLMPPDTGGWSSSAAPVQMPQQNPHSPAPADVHSGFMAGAVSDMSDIFGDGSARPSAPVQRQSPQAASSDIFSSEGVANSFTGLNTFKKSEVSSRPPSPSAPKKAEDPFAGLKEAKKMMEDPKSASAFEKPFIPRNSVERYEYDKLLEYLIRFREISIAKDIGSKITAMAFHPTREILAVGDQSGDFALIDLISFKDIYRVKNPSQFPVKTIAFSHDGKYAAYNTSENEGLILNTGNKMILTKINQVDQPIVSFVFHPGALSVYAGYKDGTLVEFNFINHRLMDFSPSVDEITRLRVSSDGQHMISGHRDGTVTLWNLTGKTMTARTAAEASPVSALVIAPNNRVLASGYDDGRIILWNLKTLKPINTLEKHRDKIDSLCFFRDKPYLFSSSEDKRVRLWSLPEGNISQPMNRDFNSAPCYMSMGSYGTTNHLAVSSGSVLNLWKNI